MSQKEERRPGGRGNGATRRDFLGLLGTALGGVSLAGCGGINHLLHGSSNNANGLESLSHSALPSAWGFNSLLDITRAFDLSEVVEFTPNIMLNNNGQVVFCAITKTGFAVYEADTTTRNARRSVTALRTIVKTGQIMPDGRVVGRIGGVDMNNNGTVGFVVGPRQTDHDYDGHVTNTEEAGAVYLSRNGSTLEPVLSPDLSVPGRHAHFAGQFGDIDVSDSDNVLVTGFYADEDLHDSREGLFYLPGGHDPRLEVSTGDVIPGSNQTITSLGLVDAGMEGTDFAIMGGSTDVDGSHDVDIESPTRGVAQVDDVYKRSGSFLLGGNMGQHRSPRRLIQSSRNVKTTRAADLSGGEVILGVRQGTVGGVPVTAYIEHLTDTHMELRLNGQSLTATSKNSPQGNNIVSLGPPVIGGGLVYYTAYTEEGIEIVATNGLQHKTVVTTRALIDGIEIKNLVLGFHPDQVNKNATILIYAELRNGSVRYIEGQPV